MFIRAHLLEWPVISVKFISASAPKGLFYHFKSSNRNKCKPSLAYVLL